MASSLVMMRVWSIVMPGTLRGDDPVATMMCFAVSSWSSPPLTTTLPLPARRARALDPRDAVLLEQALDALGEARHDLVLAGVDGGHVERRRGAAEADAPVGGVLDDLQRVRVLEQRLGRDAAPQQARAAQRLLALHDRGLEAQLRRADGRHVAAGAGANHDEVESLGHGEFTAPERWDASAFQRRQRDERRGRIGCGRLGGASASSGSSRFTWARRRPCS